MLCLPDILGISCANTERLGTKNNILTFINHLTVLSVAPHFALRRMKGCLVNTLFQTMRKKRL